MKGFAFKFKSTNIITVFRAVTEEADTTNNNDIEKDVVIEKIEEEENDNNIKRNKGE